MLTVQCHHFHELVGSRHLVFTALMIFQVMKTGCTGANQYTVYLALGALKSGVDPGSSGTSFGKVMANYMVGSIF